jgi:hypothetical protein
MTAQGELEGVQGKVRERGAVRFTPTLLFFFPSLARKPH